MSIELKRREYIVDSMVYSTGINPYSVYCQITGRPMACLESSEINLLWQTIDCQMDDDAIIDELYMRTIMAMRPSPAWNYIERDTLNRVRKTNPKSMIAYLLGRYYEPRDKAYNRLVRTVDQRLTDGANRIKLYQRITHLEQTDDLDEFVTMLLLIDAEFNLSTIDVFQAFPKSPIDLDFSNLSQYISTLQTGYLKLCATREAFAKRNAYYSNPGNPMTRNAATKGFMDLKPKSAAVIMKEERVAKMNELTNIIAAFMRGTDGVNESVAINAPAANPAITRIQPLRLKMIGVKS
jgi:hypothetical protein